MGANTLGALKSPNRQEATQLLHSGQLKTCSAGQSVRPCSCSDWDTGHPSQKGESGGYTESQYGDDIELIWVNYNVSRHLGMMSLT